MAQMTAGKAKKALGQVQTPVPNTEDDPGPDPGDGRMPTQKELDEDYVKDPKTGTYYHKSMQGGK